MKKKTAKKKTKSEDKKCEDKKSEGLGDMKNVTEGSVHLVEGFVLIAKGTFKLLGFSLAMCIDGLKWIFDKDDKSLTERKKR